VASEVVFQLLKPLKLFLMPAINYPVEKRIKSITTRLDNSSPKGTKSQSENERESDHKL
jgi:hypothetical protein